MSESNSDSSKKNPYFDNEDIKSELKSRAMRGAGATVFSEIGVFAVNFISTVVLSRILAPDSFGVVAMVMSFSLLLENFGMRGFTEATIQAEEISHRKISTLFWFHVSFNTMLTILFIAASPLIAWFYDDSRIVEIATWISFSILFSSLATQHLALLTRSLHFYRLAAVNIGAAAGSAGLAIVLALMEWDYWALVARRTSYPLMLALGGFLLCHWLPGRPARGTGVKKMLKFGVNTYGNFAMNFFSRNLDKILVGWRSGTISLGQYEKAYYLFVLPVTQLSYPLTSVVVATLSRIRDDAEQCRRYYLKALSILGFIGMPLSALVIVFGKDVILFLLGPQWDRAGEILQLFGGGIGILLIYGTHGWLFLALGRAHEWFRWGILEFVFTGLSFAAGLPFGPEGVAVAYTTAIFLLAGPGLWYAGQPINVKISELISALWPYVTCSAVAGLVSWFVLHQYSPTAELYLGLPVFFRLVIGTIVLLAIYLLIVSATCRKRRPLSATFSLVRQMVPRLAKKTTSNEKSAENS